MLQTAVSMTCGPRRYPIPDLSQTEGKVLMLTALMKGDRLAGDEANGLDGQFLLAVPPT